MPNRPFHDFYSAWRWLQDHPSMQYRGKLAFVSNGKVDFPAFPDNLEIECVKVNPATERVEDDESLNTATRIWIGATTYTEDDGTYDIVKGSFRHDYFLDTGGATFEQAIIKLALKVWKHYGDEGRPLPNVWPTNLGEPRKMKP